jgi:hypothetical protein
VYELVVPIAVAVAAVAFAVWSHLAATRRSRAVVRELVGSLGQGPELAASLDPAEVSDRVLQSAASLPGADAALLIVEGEATAVGLTDQEAERAALETPPNTNLRSMEVVYRYRLDEVRGANLPRAALVVPLRAGDGAIGSLSAVTRANPPDFPAETADALDALARRAAPALVNARRFVEATRLAEVD